MTPSNQTPYARHRLALACAVQSLTALAAQYTKDATADNYCERVKAYLDNQAFEALAVRERLIKLIG